MLERARDHVAGQIYAHIQKKAAQRLPELVHDLMDDALRRWASNNWATFDHLEINCTCQLYRWLQEAQRQSPRFNVLSVTIENVLVTYAMLNALDSIAGAARPDLRIAAGDVGVLLEAKRLSVAGDLARRYVYEGMQRYVESNYATADTWGMMVGYIQGQLDSTGVRDRVNGYVTSHPLMGKGHELGVSSVRGSGEWMGSTHSRSMGPPIELDHVWVVLG